MPAAWTAEPGGSPTAGPHPTLPAATGNRVTGTNWTVKVPDGASSRRAPYTWWSAPQPVAPSTAWSPRWPPSARRGSGS